MTVEDHPFRRVPALQHMAAVKTIEMLLTNEEHKENIVCMCFNTYFHGGKLNWGDENVEVMIKKLEIRANKIPIPETLKNYLKSFFLPMIGTAINWLVRVAVATPEPLEQQYWSETLGNLVDNLHWDNVGCIDGRNTLESFVSTRDTINFIIWNQLCYYCIEEEITRFSRIIDWNNCEQYFNSIFSLYWYRKIYGKLPTKEMHNSATLEFINKLCDFLKMDISRVYDDESILLSLFTHSYLLIPVFGQTVSAITYFRNQLPSNIEVEKLFGDSTFQYISAEVVLYSLRGIKKSTLPKFISNEFVFRHLMQPPWIMFIDDWISLFETVDGECFTEFFMIYVRRNRRQIGNYSNKIFYEPFEKVWRLYFKRFNSNRKKIMEAFFNTLRRDDLTLCKAMFKGLEDNQRKFLLKEVRDYVGDGKFVGLNKQLSAPFSENILKDDEERKLFSQIGIEWF